MDRLGKPKDALEAFREVVAADPTFAPAWFDLGVIYYNQGDYANAQAAYQNVIKYDDKNAQAHANLASTYRQLERFSEANAEFQAAAADITSVDLYSEWGYSLGKTGEWDKSVDKLNTAKEMSPTAIENNNVGWAQYNDANAKKAAKDEAGSKASYAAAKTSLQTSTKQDPKLDAAYVNLGSTHNALGEYQAAVDALNVANTLHPNWTIALNQLGVGFRGLNNLVQAVAIFKQVVDIDSKYTYGLFNLGEAYNASGNKKEAKKINDRLKKLDPSMAALLDNVFAGKAINAATQQVTNQIPKPPVKVPRFPF
jgi:tetratricopeptide (TPR) repeat protein